MDINTLKLNYKTLIYPSAVGLASLIIIIFVIVPQLQSFLSGQDDLKLKQARLNTLEVKAKELESFDQDAYTEKLLNAFYYLPVDKDYSNIIGIFRELTASAGMSLTSLHPGSATAESSYLVKADIVGQVSSLGAMLEAIEKSPRVMKLESVETSTSTSGLLNATLTVSVYYASPPQSLGAVDAPLPKLTEGDQVVLSSLIPPSAQSSSTTIILPSGKSNPFE